MLLNQYLLTSYSNFSVVIEFFTPKNGTMDTNFVCLPQTGCLKVSAQSGSKALNVLYFKSLLTKCDAFRVKGFHFVCSLNDYCFNARRYSYLSLHLNHNHTTSKFYCGPESVRHSAPVNLNSHGTKKLPRKRSNLRNVQIQLVCYPAKDKQREIRKNKIKPK